METKVCPSLLLEGYNGYSPAALASLFQGEQVSHILDFDFEKDIERLEIAKKIGRISVSGVQEKMSVFVENGKIRLVSPCERSTYILKPAPLDHSLNARKQIPANEHLTMQIASQVYKIPTANNGLCFDRSGHPVYITRRFDILPDGSKMLMDDFATIIGRNEQSEGKFFKYDGCYEDIAMAIRNVVTAWPVALDSFFRLVIFNYIYGNADAHLKNFSIIIDKQETKLAPAYDLMNTFLHIGGEDLGLLGGLMKSGWKSDVCERTGHPCKKDFEVFGSNIGLSPQRVKSIINDFSILPEQILKLIDLSFLDKKMKRKYLSIIQERLSRFLRESD